MSLRASAFAELSEAVTAHGRALQNQHLTGEAVAKARERYDRFTLHGMIPDDLRDDDASPSSGREDA
jgi:hypothetical protein